MASYSVSASEHGAYAKTLAASTVDTVTFGKDVDTVEIVSDGAAAVYVTVDGSIPTVAGAATWHLPAGAVASRLIEVPTSGDTVVKLISSGTPKYSVAEASS